MSARVILSFASLLAVSGETPLSAAGKFLDGQCVTVDAAVCNPDQQGTMNMDDIASDTLLMVSGWSDSDLGFYTITDVKTYTYTRCPEAAVHASDNSECPTNRISQRGLNLLYLVLLSQVLFRLYACYSSAPLHPDLPNVPFGAVVYVWMNKFWIAVSVAMVVQDVAWMAPRLEKSIVSFLTAALMIDLPLFVARMVANGCFCIKETCFLAFIGVFGACFAAGAFGMAYMPAKIAVLGPNPLLWGLLNFVLTIPKATAQHYVHDFFCAPEAPEKLVYVPIFSELAHPVRWLYPDAPEGEESSRLAEEGSTEESATE